MGLLQLAFDKLRVHAVWVCHELGMCAPLDDTMSVNYADQVSVLHRAQTMGNDKNSPLFHSIFNRSLHQMLRLSVKG